MLGSWGIWVCHSKKVFTFFLVFTLFQSAEARILNVPLKKIVFDENKLIEICWLDKENSVKRPLQIEIENFLLQQLVEQAGFSIRFHFLCLSIQNLWILLSSSFTTVSTIHRKSPPRSLASLRLWIFQDTQEPTLEACGQKNLLISIALHEVLHTLGIDHEQVDLTPLATTKVELLICEFMRWLEPTILSRL